MYLILFGDIDNSFIVDFDSGVFFIIGFLDWEKYDFYILLVCVLDFYGNYSYGVVFDDFIVVEVVVEVSGFFF